MITGISFIVIILLYISSENKVQKENNFIRRFLPHPIIEDKVLELDNEYYYFAGIQQDHLFLRNKSFPLQISYVERSSTTLQPLRNYPDQTDFYYTNLHLKKQQVLTITCTTVVFHHLQRKDNRFSVIDSLNFVVKIRSSETDEYELGSITLNPKPKS